MITISLVLRNQVCEEFNNIQKCFIETNMLNIFVLFNIDALSKPRVEIAPPNLPPCAQ